MTQWHVVDGAGQVAFEASRRIAAAAKIAIAERGRFCLVLAGGSTPLAAYRLLAQSQQDWRAWHLFFGDERCLPADDPQRNSVLVAQTGLSDKVGSVHPIDAELGPERAAEAYRTVVEEALPFDLVLLGMGEDGHTASLFPGHSREGGNVLPVSGAPKPPPERVSLSISGLQDCRQMLVMVVGDGKRGALQAWRSGADLPIANVCDCEQCEVLVDSGLMESSL